MSQLTIVFLGVAMVVMVFLLQRAHTLTRALHSTLKIAVTEVRALTEENTLYLVEIARLRVIEVAARDLIDNSPIDDKDRPYISDVTGSEFEALVGVLKRGCSHGHLSNEDDSRGAE